MFFKIGYILKKYKTREDLTADLEMNLAKLQVDSLATTKMKRLMMT